jgi:RHS repeat-associated protein
MGAPRSTSCGVATDCAGSGGTRRRDGTEASRHLVKPSPISNSRRQWKSCSFPANSTLGRRRISYKWWLYDELGERTKTKPTSGPATTYGYDQAGDLTSVERPKEGEVSEIKDTYAYDGNGLRASQTISGTTTNLAWDMTEGLPLILSDETNSYIYGPGGIPVEQVSSGGTVTYLHHDQQGSIRLLTGSAGTVTGKCTYGAYGTPTCEGASTTPLGYDAQYTSSDTGLIYLRARSYDPMTAQFISVDPRAGETRARYNYASDNPLSYRDRSGQTCRVPVLVMLPSVWSCV